MRTDLLKLLLDSYIAPRATVRGVIDRAKGPADIAVIFGLSFTISAIVLAIMLLAEGVDGVAAIVFTNLFASIVSFGLLVAAVTGAGRIFGGVGTLQDVAAAMAWHSLVTVIFSPFLSLEAIQAGTGPEFWGQLAIFAVVLWLMSNYIAEAHRFRSVGKVALAFFVILVVPALLMFIANPAPM